MTQHDITEVIEKITRHLSEANIAEALAELKDESIYRLTVILDNIGSTFTQNLFEQPEFIKLICAQIHHVAHLDYIYDDVPQDRLHEVLMSIRRDILREHINSADRLRTHVQQLPTVTMKREFLDHLNFDDRYHDTYHVRRLLLSSTGFKAYYSHKHGATHEEAALFDSCLSQEISPIKSGEELSMALEQVPAQRQLEFIHSQINSHGPRFLAEIIHDAYELNSILSSIHFQNVKIKFLKLLDKQSDNWVSKFDLENPQAAEHLSEFESIKRFLAERASKVEEQPSSSNSSRRGSQSSGRYQDHALKRW